MLANAESYYQRVSVSATKATTKLEEATKALEAARSRHNPAYLEHLSLAEAQAAAKGAKRELGLAKQGGHPDKIWQHSKAASAFVAAIRKNADSITGYIQFLDKALERYQTEPERLAQKTQDARHRIADLVIEGYFPHHFESAKSLLSVADERKSFAIGLRRQVVWNGLPDYKQVYEVCLVADTKITNASAICQAVVDLRQSNSERIGTLSERLEEAERLYSRARVAAMNLEAYPRYRILDEVYGSQRRLQPVAADIGSAQKQNSMYMQEFAKAAALLDQTSETIASAKKCFDQAIGTWSRLASAINQIPGAESDAVSQINSARSHISSYSYNSQGTAESYLATARSELRNGRRLKDSDPIEALKSFREAESQASSAYTAVDTSSRDDDTSSSDWGSSSPSSDSSGWGSGGGGMSSPSGGMSSGPSGGMSSGPSGGMSSGPSGGGVGSGSF
jgi:hypothetical protein